MWLAGKSHLSTINLVDVNHIDFYVPVLLTKWRNPPVAQKGFRRLFFVDQRNSPLDFNRNHTNLLEKAPAITGRSALHFLQYEWGP